MGDRQARADVTEQPAASDAAEDSPGVTQDRTRHAHGRGAARHRERQAKEREQAAELWQEQGLVFCQEDGSALHPSSVSKRFRILVRQAGLPALTLHGMRHTYATLATAAGVPPQVLSRRLGHARVEITLGIYGHLLPGGDQTAAGAVADRILGVPAERDDEPDQGNEKNA